MSKLLFLSRVTLICNVCFLITFLLHYLPFLNNGIITSTIIILGNVLAIVINIMLHVLCLFLKFAGKQLTPGLPVWLILINFLFFVFQIILLIK